MKDRHLRLELAQDSPSSTTTSGSSIRAIGWDKALRSAALGLTKGSRIDIAYRIRENDHPQYGGLEIEIAGIEPASF
jgi:single-stranded-DNA-specific exonuclease